MVYICNLCINGHVYVVPIQYHKFGYAMCSMFPTDIYGTYGEQVLMADNYGGLVLQIIEYNLVLSK